MTNDAQLLRQYVENRSEGAFAQLVERHVSMVYHSALRQLGGDSHLAQDVAQTVFVLLAEKSRSLLGHPSLAGWLHATTRFKAARARDSERRRRSREQAAYSMQEVLTDSPVAVDWERVRPVLDEVVLELSERDRAAIVLRFFEGRPFSDIGDQLRLTESASCKRVERALDKLRARLSRRGITASAAALAAAMSAPAEMAVPVDLAATVTDTALASAVGASALSSTTAGLIAFMRATKTAIGLAGVFGIAAILSVSVLGITVHEIKVNRRVQTELSASIQKLDAETAELRSLRQKLQFGDETRSELPVHGKSSATGLDPLAEGRKFLNAFPQARDLFMRTGRSWAGLAFATFFRSANLTSGQIQQFENLMASTWLGNLAVSGGRAGAGPGDPTADQLNRILGEHGAQEYQAFQQTMQYPCKFTAPAAAAARLAGAPLSDEQVDQLAQIIVSSSGPYQIIPGTLGVGNANAASSAVDWDSVLAQAKAVLSTPQFAAVQGQFLGTEFNAELGQAQAYP